MFAGRMMFCYFSKNNAFFYIFVGFRRKYCMQSVRI